jgi:Zn-dependent protease
MRGPPSEFAAPPIYVYPSAPKARVRFSRTELIQLFVAILALSAAFTIVYVRARPQTFAANPASFLAVFFPASLLAVGTGLGLHEVMHKVVAQRYGHWAEFRYNPQGLLLAFVLAAAIAVLYGAPGATWISGQVTREQNGRISAAGPLTNVMIATALLVPYVILLPYASDLGAMVVVSVSLLHAAASVNAFLGLFNLLPIMPLDGAKVLAWNKPAYAALVVTAVALVIFTLYWPIG